MHINNLRDGDEDTSIYLLNDTTTIHLTGQLQDMISHLLRQDLFLNLVSMLVQLLHHIVSKHVGHELKRIWLNLAKDLLLLVAVGRL